MYNVYMYVRVYMYQEEYEKKNYKVVAEFEGGQNAYGFEGLCVRASMSEANEIKLMLMGSDEKGKVLRETVKILFCIKVDEHVSKNRSHCSLFREPVLRRG